MDEDDFDLTQPMSLGFEDEEPAAEANDSHYDDFESAVMLKVPLQDGIPKELEFSLHEGINKIGRNESCEICIKKKVLSKEHAVIEVGADWFLICDLNSSNKTWKGTKSLKPNVKYKLEPNDEIMFGNIKTQFIVRKHGDAEGGDSGSETGSESMLLLNEEYCAFSVSTPIKNPGVNEGGNSPSQNAPASDSSFSKAVGDVKLKNEPLQEASLDLENAPTQEFSGNLSDSGDETDCENHSEEKPVNKKQILQSNDKGGSHCEVKTLGIEDTTNNNTSPVVTETVDHDRKPPEKAPDMVQGNENVVTDHIPERKFFSSYEQLLESRSLESNDDLPPTQINLALKNHTAVDYSGHINIDKCLNSEDKVKHSESLDLPSTQINLALKSHTAVDYSRHMNIDKCLNSEDKIKHSESFDSLPETQLDTRNCSKNQEFSKISRTETGRIYYHVVVKQVVFDNNADNLNNDLEEKVLESDDETKSSDDLPPTQLNCAVQFSQEDNVLQHDDSYCLFKQNSSLSPRPSTSSGTGYFRKSTGSIHSLGNSHKKLNIDNSRIIPEENDKDNSVTNKDANKDTKMAVFSCINISMDEGSDVLCPATQRRSDCYNGKIKNTDVQSSPVLDSVSGKMREDVAETPPHLLQELTLTDVYSSAVLSLSKQLSEVSVALSNNGAASTSHAEEKTSDNLHTPGSHGEPSVKASTPDSAKAGESNYTGNYSPKVYKTKLNNLDENCQEAFHPGEVAAEAAENDIHSDKSKKRGKRGRKPRTSKKLNDCKTEAHGNATDKRSLLDSHAGSITKKSKNDKSVADSGVLKLSVDQHSKDTGGQEQTKKLSPYCHTKIKKPLGNKHSPDACDHEEDDQGEVQKRTSQRRKSKRLAPANYVKTEISQKNDKSANSFSPPESHTEKENLEESVASSVSTRSSRSSVNNSAEKKNLKNEPARKSKRQKFGCSKATRNKQNCIGESVSSELVDESSDFASVPRRKYARKKLLPSELDCVDTNYNPEMGFSAFRRIEASEAGMDNLVDSRVPKSRTAALSKDSSPVNGNLSKLIQLAINESEVSVSSSGEQCNIKLEKDGSTGVQHLKCEMDDEETAFIPDQSGDIKKKASPIVTKLNILPTAQRRGRMKGKARTDKTEMQIDFGSETTDDNDKSFSIEKEVQDITLAGLVVSSPYKRQFSEPRRSRRKKKSPIILDGDSASSASEVSVDENATKLGKCQISVFAKDSVESLIRLKDVSPSFKDSKSPEIIQHTRGKNPSVIEDESAVPVPEIKKRRQSHLKQGSKVDTASPAKSKYCQNSDLSSAFDSVSEKEVNPAKNKRVKTGKEEGKTETAVSGVKNGRMSRSKLTSKDDSSFPTKNKRQHNSDSSLVSNNMSEKDVNLTKNKKAKLSEEEENISVVPEIKSGRTSRSKLKSTDNVCSSPKSKHHHSSTSSSVSDSVSEKEVTPAKNKKANTAKDKHVTFASPSSRQQPQTLKPKVMFTMVEDEEPQKVVLNLGGRVVEDVKMCTHLVADKLRRTVKALCCVAKGIPLVNTKWIQECKKSESFVDYVPYLIKDKAAEKQYGFVLQKTLQKATEKPLLTSWSIHVTPKVVPSPEQMKDIIQCAGGKYLPKMPNRLSEKTVVITCAADLNLCSHAAKCGIPIVGSEFILTGLLQYKTDTKSYILNKK